MSMEFLIATAIGALTWAGIYLCLRARTFPVVLGTSMLSYAINLFLFAIGRLKVDAPPIFHEGAAHTDPLPQALVLTAIVISFGMSALTVVLALRSFLETGTDQVDGESDPAIDPLDGDHEEWIERRNAHRIDMIGEERP